MNERHPLTCAVIVAAGQSRRMGIPKILYSVQNKTVIERCLENFESSKCIDSIVIVTSPQHLDEIKKFATSKVIAIGLGGQTRQDSVKNALSLLPNDCAFIAIHDAARPFTSPDLIDTVCKAAYRYGAAAPVIPVTSTVKQINADGNISSTIDRDQLRLVQTPQVFKLDEYVELLNSATTSGYDLTDDCQLWEMQGKTVYSVDGCFDNIKLTTPDDLVIADFIAQRMDES